MTARGAMRERWALLCCGLAAAFVASATVAGAQQGCASAPASSSIAWPAPLDRIVSVDAQNVTVGEALDQLSRASQTSFAYASDLLAHDRRVCLGAQRGRLGDLITALLAGTGLAPSVVAGRVVLVPRAASAPVNESERVAVLDRVIVTGNGVATARRALPIGIEVIEGATLRRRGLGALAEILDGTMPGAWLWGSTSNSLLAQYGGIRGASSFGTSAPKIYVDGIQVANPLLMTQLDPDAVDRIEIIRGPQGSALYGSDAISGVINVLTRHDGRAPDAPHVLLSSVAGATSSDYGTGLVTTHEQRVALRLGSSTRSAGIAAQFGQVGAVIPSADSRSSSLVADGRVSAGRSILSGSARFLDRRLGAGRNPLLSAAVADTAPGAARAPQSAREYALGSTFTISPDGNWTHSLVVGLDGYRVDHVDASESVYPVATDSSLYALRGAGDRSTLRLTTVGQFGEGTTSPATLTVGIEQSVLRRIAPVDPSSIPPANTGTVDLASESSTRWNHNLGAFVQLSTGFADALYVTGGLRVEQNDAVTGISQPDLLPMIGVASVHEIGPASVKLRAAYGRGIRPPSTTSRGSSLSADSYGIRSLLNPEVQAGTELGVELYLGKAASLQITRFDQTASDLIQNVLVGIDTSAHGGSPARQAVYQLQNVGVIGNHGWEVQGAVTRGALTVGGTWTAVDSRVEMVSRGYGGEMRSGDRMLGVPARTASLNAAWTAPEWSASVSASRAASWVNYDRLALARDAAAATSGSSSISGAQLRRYWMDYDGATHVRATGTRAMRAGVDLVLTADNLLGTQVGEPDNATIRPGRTIMAGLRAGF